MSPKQFPFPIRAVSLIAIVWLLTIVASDIVAAQPRSNCSRTAPCQLRPGDRLTQLLGGGGSHSYRLQLPADRVFQIIVQQKGIDVVLLLSSDGQELSEVDRPNGSRGRETLSHITAKEGTYDLTIRSFESVSAKGHYELRVNLLREPGPRDKTWIAAEERISQAERLRSKMTASSFRSSIQLFHEAADLWRQLNEPYEEAIALYGIGLSSFSLADNQDALGYLNRALELFGSDAHGQAITMAALGWPYMYLGNHEKAESSFNRALEGYRVARNRRGQGIALYGLGWIHALRGENARAYGKFIASLKHRRAAQDRRGQAITLAGIGKVQARLGQYPKAISSLNASLKLLGERDEYARSDSLSNLGWVFNAMGEEALALDHLTRALAMRQRVGDRIGEATTLYGIGVSKQRLGHLEDAVAAIDSAIGIIEKLRIVGTNQQLRISYFASVQDYYDFYISLLMQLHRKEPGAGYEAKAFHVYERGRARGLIDLLTEAQIDLHQGADPALLEEERRLDEKINAAGTRRYNLLSSGDSSAEAKKATEEVNELAAQYEAIQARLRANNPRYGDIARPQPTTASQIQQVIGDDTLLLEYALGDTRSFVWAVSQSGFACFELPERDTIERLARSTYKHLTARNATLKNESERTRLKRLSRHDTAAQKGLEKLGRMLLAVVADRLDKKRVLIVAPGILQFIPFAALPGPVSSLPLIKDHEVLLLPSATTLLSLRKQRQSRSQPSKTIAVIADPVYSAGDARLPGAQFAHNPRTTALSEFPRLLGSLWEAKKIASYVPPDETKVLLDFGANRSAVLHANLDQYRFLHVAAHALIDNEHPQLSGLVFSTVDEFGRPQEGFLRSNAIFKLKLSADLVVLSSCRTALGKDFKGEGLIGLTRAFMYAGAQRVVASLWDVEDRATSELMVRFYDAVLGPDKLSAAAALRKAQVELSNDPRWKSPYYWAAFVSQGEW